MYGPSLWPWTSSRRCSANLFLRSDAIGHIVRKKDTKDTKERKDTKELAIFHSFVSSSSSVSSVSFRQSFPILPPMSRLAPQATDFPQWYLDVIAQAGLAEHADVKGCIIFKPYGYALWENIQRDLDRRIKELGVENAYFPLFIPESVMID